MAINPINSTTSVSSTTTNNSTDSKSDKDLVSMDSFLKLFVEELKHQDPLQPMENSEYITQLAQISLLEQMKNFGKSMDELLKVETDTNKLIKNMNSPLSTYSDLIGKSAFWNDKDGVESSGLVEGIIKKEFEYYAVINGKEVNVNSISKIFDKALTDTPE